MVMEAEFIKAVVKQLEEKWEGKKQVEILPVTKNNGVVQMGLSPRGQAENVRTIVSLEPYYEQYKKGKVSLDEVIEDLYGLMGGDGEEESDFWKGDFSCYQKLKGRIVLRLINRELNQEILEEVPHIPFLDMEIVFMIGLGQNGKGQMSAPVCNSMMQEWGESPQGLFSQAQKNMPLLNPVILESMEDVLRNAAKRNWGEGYDEEKALRLWEDKEEKVISMYVLTNERGIYGAAAMLYPNLLRNFAESQRTDVVILPSSVHEVILVPVKELLDFGWLRDMVRNVNQTEVPLEDQLSDQVYIYRRKEDQVEIAE